MSQLSIVMYHYVRDLQNSRYPKIKGLDYTLFKQQIKFFSEKYNVVTMEEVLAYYKEGYKLPENAMLLTFDDGYIDHFLNVTPVLKEYGMQGSFFVPGKVFVEHSLLDVNKIHFLLASAEIDVLCKDLFEQLDYYRSVQWEYPDNETLFTEYAVANRFDNKETIFFKRVLQSALPEKLRGIISSNMFKKYVGIPEDVMARELYLNYDQMKNMKTQGMFFGVHGYDHYWMNKLSLEQLHEDIQKGKDAMGDLINPKEWVINYPYGSYSEMVVENLKNSGCVLGLSTEVRVANLKEDNPLILPRLDTNDFPPIKMCFQINEG